ncbi:MAG: hypothetical protein M0Q42_07050 [Xanthomonadales bacterium]|nr:hypothetical protein [Xanthomonadales bacterium]
MGSLTIPVATGELADKITILEIKLERIDDAGKQANVRAELDSLLPLWRQVLAASDAGQASGAAQDDDEDLEALKSRLREVNERMWQIQDGLRECERQQRFDAEFVRLARAVATTNGERVAIKNAINRLSGSAFVEEKQYRGEAAGADAGNGSE